MKEVTMTQSIDTTPKRRSSAKLVGGIGNLQRRLLGVVDMPENDRVHIDGNRILGQRLFGIESVAPRC
jgi:hypothetical protein